MGLIAKGVPRSRHICLVNDPKDKKRILYYDTKNKAISGYRDSGFYGENGVDEYCREKYKKGWYDLKEKILIPVRAILTLEIGE